MAFSFYGVFSQLFLSSLIFNVCHPLLLLLKLNEWVNEVESIDSSALPLKLFIFICFRQFGEDPCSPLPSSAPCHSDPSIHIIKKHQDYCLPRPNSNSAKIWPYPRTQNCFFPFLQRKTQKIQIKHTYLFTSLKLVFIFHYKSSQPLWRPFAEIDPERALSRPRRASYEAERGLM